MNTTTTAPVSLPPSNLHKSTCHCEVLCNCYAGVPEGPEAINLLTKVIPYFNPNHHPRKHREFYKTNVRQAKLLLAYEVVMAEIRNEFAVA